ncbi:Acetyltransferase (isoleucine patch superfamily protein) [Ectocarpus siliculosus]|uniref:Acetyltransferase (Isoleucine patch superfamily protein) n=1 Tax=Ectocarpus siliculosus TaxID=2880 RepID=D7FXI2_ECTSI|nr:Acetyltransferase (isoleucine patch superfamily protein) [Ectocarpus siliculosus]|eukprot:CBJ32319.1 Acetyltransferase (isoleucine patch superfamily protein) [Ectocarpus siliculosus]
MAAMAMVTSSATTAKNVSFNLLPLEPLPVISPEAVCADWAAWVPPMSGPTVVMQVEAGHDVIMSDADALWLADPMKDFSLPGVVGSSIVASRGSVPTDVGHVWGATICMGFILFRTTASRVAMREFVTVMNALVLEEKDDQIAVNIAARDLGIVWNEEDSDMRYTESTGFGVGFIDSLSDKDNQPFTVTLLPHSTYTRICASTPVSNTTVVAHCLSSKTPQSKADWMHRMDLWAVDGDTR